MHCTILSALAVLATASLVACKSETNPKAHILRLDQALEQFASLDSAHQAILADSLALPIADFFAASGLGAPSIEVLQQWSTGDVVKAFQPIVDENFPNLDDIEEQLGDVMANAKAAGLDLPQLSFTAITWGKPQPIMRVGDDMLIALNHYLGENFDGYSHLQPYRRPDKNPDRLPYDAAAAIVATQYPFETDQAPTLLNWMLYEGALIQAKMDLVPQAQLHVALGYTPRQLEILEDNYQDIWQELVLSRQVHSTDPALIDRMLTPAPNTPLLKGTAPGRVGRYIGYILVRDYMKKQPASTLPFLLSPDFYTKSDL